MRFPSRSAAPPSSRCHTSQPSTTSSPWTNASAENSRPRSGRAPTSEKKSGVTRAAWMRTPRPSRTSVSSSVPTADIRSSVRDCARQSLTFGHETEPMPPPPQRSQMRTSRPASG